MLSTLVFSFFVSSAPSVQHSFCFSQCIVGFENFLPIHSKSESILCCRGKVCLIAVHVKFVVLQLLLSHERPRSIRTAQKPPKISRTLCMINKSLVLSKELINVELPP